jgi:hypothetical protein
MQNSLLADMPYTEFLSLSSSYSSRPIDLEDPHRSSSAMFIADLRMNDSRLMNNKNVDRFWLQFAFVAHPSTLSMPSDLCTAGPTCSSSFPRALP